MSNLFYLMDIITLVGPRAVGKSTVGRILANEMGYQFFDVDKYMHNKLEKEGGIGMYVDKYGWKKYMNLLRWTLRHEIMPEIIESNKKVVLDCGGGMIGSEFGASKSMAKLLRKHSKIIMLIPHEDDQKGLKILYERELERPYWKGLPLEEIKEEIRKHYYERVPLIKKQAHHIIHVNDRSVRDIVKFIRKSI
jgi:shikimate kinase